MLPSVFFPLIFWMYNKLRVKYSFSSSPLYESMFFQAGKAQKPTGIELEFFGVSERSRNVEVSQVQSISG